MSVTPPASSLPYNPLWMGPWVCHCALCGEYRIIKGLMAGEGLVLALRMRYERLGGGGGEG